jgi:transposase
MDAIIERCCGLDVHQETVVACLLVSEPGKRPRKELRTFGAMKHELEQLRQWLLSAGCTHVAMESTGVYWMPVYVALEDSFSLVVGNATHIKNVPGRKTDVKDSEWIADLLRHGLIRASYVPPKPLRELRDLLRYRRKLVEAQASSRNRLLKLLVTASIKLACVASDVFGASGRLMLRALIKGTATPEEMAGLAKGALRKKKPLLALALDGRVEEHHRFMLEIQLERVESDEAAIAKLDVRIDEQLKPYAKELAMLRKIPGVDRIGAAVIVAELGTDMTVFPTAAHAAAWAGVAPGNHESAGKRKNQPTRNGNVHLMTALVQAAMCAAKKKGSFLSDKYWRLRARRGPKKAAVAIAHKILVAAYHMLARKADYRDLGPGYVDRAATAGVKRKLVDRLERMGYRVYLDPVAAPA